MDFHLINLDCPACGSAMKAGAHDTLFFCAHCGSGAVLGESALDIIDSSALMPSPGYRAALWLPGWAIEVDVIVRDRIQKGGRTTPGWADRRKFVIPAFTLGLEDLTPLASSLSSAAGTTGDVPSEPCLGGTLDLEDALVFIRYLIVGTEIQKPDDLASITVDITAISHSIVALPFERSSGRLRCAITGTVVRDPGV